MSGLLGLFKPNHHVPPWGWKWRSNTFFILTTVGIGIMSDLFIYGVIVPILPYLLQDRLNVPKDSVQWHVSLSLALYAAATLVMSPVAGFIADRTSSRQMPFLIGLTSLAVGVVLMFVGQSLLVIHLSRLLQGASSGFVWSVGIAMCIDTVGSDNLGKTLGTIFSVMSIAELSAPVLGGVVYKHGGVFGVAMLCLAILAVDFLMRLLVVEKRFAARFESFEASETDESDNNATNQTSDGANSHADENTNGHADTESSALLGKKNDDDRYYVPPDQPAIIRKLPIIYTLGDSGMLCGFALTLVVSFVIGSYDSTIPTHAGELFGFDSMQAGMMFMPLVAMNAITGPLGGWIVDKRGTKLPAVIGFTFLVPSLILLRIPQAHPMGKNIALWSVFLAMTGLSLGLGGGPSMVEVGSVVHKYHERNPELFGENGPYAQIYGLNSMIFSLGLTIGPILAGSLKDTIGYGNMNAVVAAVAACTAVLCFFYLGGPPANFLRKKEDHVHR